MGGDSKQEMPLAAGGISHIWLIDSKKRRGPRAEPEPHAVRLLTGLTSLLHYSCL